MDAGLTEPVLDEVLSGKRLWKLQHLPTIGFYRHLHHYLKSERHLSKVSIGRLYCIIDSNFEEKGSRADNIYR